MLTKKKIIFLAQMKPIIEKLTKDWFPADSKTPDGLHYYACTHCDMECGGHIKHDDYCLYQRAKNTTDSWNQIDINNQWDLDFRKNLRSMKEIVAIKELFKYDAVFENFIIDSEDFVPLDYSDPANKGVLCTCCIFEGPGDEENHHPECPYVQVAKALSELYKI